MNRKKLAVIAAALALIAVFATRTADKEGTAQKEVLGRVETSTQSSTENSVENSTESSAENSTQNSAQANKQENVPEQNTSGEDVSAYESFLLDSASLNEGASFVGFETGGKEGEFIVVKEEDGALRVALNTCQVCNGSPYAYFVQEGDKFICQNCGNPFSYEDIGVRKGGCNPIPLGVTEEAKEDGTVILPAELMEQCADYFNNWKNF